ncbi:hypothetical protein IHN63_07960 [Deinococcus sp. 6YEL10]|uniref:hypothetical protein n=1 Tax=Deinococcus sp. 6YEL10 TaxID=2745870 RepID=UPI001E4B7791|nr:hypothetical protein [Deinococcus sp. 6YEL10]MCD0161240.1 hypothetical protein [Deinococcus sp. 6YEL10]
MSTFFFLLWLACTIAMIVWLIQGIKKKAARRKALYAFGAGLASFVAFSVATPAPAKTETASTPTQSNAPTPVTPAAASPEPTPITGRAQEFTDACTTALIEKYPDDIATRDDVKVTYAPVSKNNRMVMQVQAGTLRYSCTESPDGATPVIAYADPATAKRLAAERAAQAEAARQAEEATRRAEEAQAQASREAAEREARQAACQDVDLVIESWNWTTDSGYVRGQGQVTNVSGDSLDSVMAEMSYYTQGDEFIKSDDAMIEYQPVLDGQTSPFSTITTGNPAMAKASLSMKVMFGGTMNTMDRKEYDAACS